MNDIHEVLLKVFSVFSLLLEELLKNIAVQLSKGVIIEQQNLMSPSTFV